MRELLREILGWLGYLERPPVLLQLVLAIGLILLTREARRRHWLRRLAALAYPPVGLATLALVCLVLAVLQQPYGLTAHLGMFWLGWYSLGLLRLLLARWLPPNRLDQ
ncbi:MAG: mechanosensitive ion channel protein MscS, partial [Cyanobium sp.]